MNRIKYIEFTFTNVALYQAKLHPEVEPKIVAKPQVGLSRTLRWAVRVPGCSLPSRNRVCGNRATPFSKQMGNSAAMIERHYSKLTATMAADRLA